MTDYIILFLHIIFLFNYSPYSPIYTDLAPVYNLFSCYGIHQYHTITLGIFQRSADFRHSKILNLKSKQVNQFRISLFTNTQLLTSKK